MLRLVFNQVTESNDEPISRAAIQANLGNEPMKQEVVMQKGGLWLSALLKAFGASVAVVVATQFSVVYASPAIHAEGILLLDWGDPLPGSGLAERTEVSVTSVSGRKRWVLEGFPLPQAQLLRGRYVRVASENERVVAEGLSVLGGARVLSSEPRAAEFSTSAVGTKRLLHILLRFQEYPKEVFDPDFILAMTNPKKADPAYPTPSTINEFFSRVSGQRLLWRAGVAGIGGLGAPGGWYVLPRSRNEYSTCAPSFCANLQLLATDAMGLARASGIDVSVYDAVSMIFNTDLDGYAWGGGFYDPVSQKSYSATWSPPWAVNVPTFAHELGHAIGLPHSGWVYSAYDSPWDVMSDRSSIESVICGSYTPYGLDHSIEFYVTCGVAGNAYITPHLLQLGWLSTSELVTVTAGGKVWTTLQRLSSRIKSAKRMLKICLPGLDCNRRYFSVESRAKDGTAATDFDNGIPADGLIIHDVDYSRVIVPNSCFMNNQYGFALPVDLTPGDFDSATCRGTGLYNAQLNEGQTYTNSRFGFSVTYVKKVNDGYRVKVLPSP